jgi:hypothetical protein
MGHNGVKVLFLALAFVVLVAVSGWASAQDTGVVCLVSVEDSLNGTFLGGPDLLVNVGNVSRTTMTDPLIIMGSNADLLERQISGRITVVGGGGSFDKNLVLSDSTETYDGVSISDHDLIVVGGPDHNAYTKMLLDAGYLKYTATDKKFPTIIFEVLTGPNGHKVIVIGDASGYTYHKKDLPTNGIIPEEMAPVAAALVGMGLGVIGALLSNTNLFSSLPGKALNFLAGLVGSHMVEVTSEAEVKVTKAGAREKEARFFGFSMSEIVLALVAVALVGVGLAMLGGALS